MDILEKRREYYIKNREELLKKSKQYYYDNRIERQAYNKEYWMKNGNKYVEERKNKKKNKKVYQENHDIIVYFN